MGKINDLDSSQGSMPELEGIYIDFNKQDNAEKFAELIQRVKSNAAQENQY